MKSERNWIKCPGPCRERFNLLGGEHLEDGAVIQCRCGHKIRFGITVADDTAAVTPQLQREVLNRKEERKRRIFTAKLMTRAKRKHARALARRYKLRRCLP